MGLFSGLYGLMGGGTGFWYSAEEAAVADPANDPALTTAVEQTLNKQKANVPKGKVVQACALQKGKKNNTPQHKPNDKRCNFSAIKITKEDRKHTLVVEASTPANERKLCIVAGYKNNPAKVTAELVDFYGPHQCAHVNKKTFSTGSATPKKYPGNTDHKLVIGLTSGTKIKIFPWGYKPVSMPISASRCSHPSEAATIDIYPDTEAELKIAYDCGNKKTSSDTQTEIATKRLPNQKKRPNMRAATQTDTTTTKDETEKALSITGSLKYDGQAYEIEVALKNTITAIKKVEKVVEKAVKTIKQIKKEIAEAAVEDVFDSPVSFGILLPKVAFGISGKWEEEEGACDVSYVGGIKVEADPFIGLKFEWNVTDTILQSIPVGMAAKRILKKMEASLLELVLSASGNIGGELELTIKGWAIDNVSGKIAGKIPITAELTAVKFERDIYLVHLAVEAKGGIESGFFAEISYDKAEGAIVGKAGMLNLVIWYSLGISTGIAEEDNDANTAVGEKAEPAEGDIDIGNYNLDPTLKNILYEWDFDEDASEIFRYNFKDQ